MRFEQSLPSVGHTANITQIELLKRGAARSECIVVGNV